jgi:hypothetical protein
VDRNIFAVEASAAALRIAADAGPQQAHRACRRQSHRAGTASPEVLKRSDIMLLWPESDRQYVSATEVESFGIGPDQRHVAVNGAFGDSQIMGNAAAVKIKIVKAVAVFTVYPCTGKPYASCMHRSLIVAANCQKAKEFGSDGDGIAFFAGWHVIWWAQTVVQNAIRPSSSTLQQQFLRRLQRLEVAQG